MLTITAPDAQDLRVKDLAIDPYLRVTGTVMLQTRLTVLELAVKLLKDCSFLTLRILFGLLPYFQYFKACSPHAFRVWNMTETWMISYPFSCQFPFLVPF